MLDVVKSVVVDRRTYFLGATGVYGTQHQTAATSRQHQHAAARAVGNPHHVEALSAVFKKLLRGRCQARPRPYAAKNAPELAVVREQYRCIQGAAQGTADKGGRSFRADVDRLIERRNFGDRDAAIN